MNDLGLVIKFFPPRSLKVSLTEFQSKDKDKLLETDGRSRPGISRHGCLAQAGVIACKGEKLETF